MLYLYALTLFLGSTLLFLIEPMFAKMVLPLLGGTPAVWNTCTVFFQIALLVGYAYAHLMTMLFRAKRHALIHVVLFLLPLMVLPVIIPQGWMPPRETNPIPWLLMLMLVTVGLPFTVVSTTAPVIQRWFANTDHPAKNDPYFLYAASNAGSFVGLIGYIVLVEPHFTLAQQGVIWKYGYILLLALTVLCAFTVMRSKANTETAAEADTDVVAAEPQAVESVTPSLDTNVTMLRRLRWIILAFVPSSLMLGVTTYITTDVATFPLLWVIPLALYLFTFIIVFARRKFVPTVVLAWLLPILVLTQALLTGRVYVWLPPLHLVTFFIAALLCHNELAEDRPHSRHLTEFYLIMSIGGALGGLFNALIAPLIFDGILEYPIVLALACFMMFRPSQLTVQRKLIFARSAWVLGIGVWAVYLALQPYKVKGYETMLQERSFFGVLRVTKDVSGNVHQLGHGTTLHGTQFTQEKFRQVATSYFFGTGPIGQVISTLIQGHPEKIVGVIGLGAGTLSAYAEPGQSYTFYEIDPAVLRVASDTRYFTYLDDCKKRGVNLKVVLGDARLTMESETPDNSYDLIVLDAFSSDSIPTHLVTRESLQIYLKKLKPHGVVAFHISNRFLKLRPIVGDLAADAGLFAMSRYDAWISAQEQAWGKSPSHWVILARDKADFGPLVDDYRWRSVQGRPGKRPWTDDFSNILDALLQPKPTY